MLIPIGNDHQQEEFGPSVGRTPFQTAYVIAVAACEDVDFFCGNPRCDEPYRGPFTLLFYTTDRVIHADRVGQTRVLAKRYASVA